MGDVTGHTAPIGWGILGCGGVADGFARALSSLDDARLAAVCSRRHDRAQAFADRHGAAACHESAADLVCDPSVDVVYIATPNHRHLADVLLCLSNDVPVLCEKPLALDADAARTIAHEARRRELFCMEAMWMRFIPAIRRVAELVDQGAIGAIHSLHADFSIDVPFDSTSRLFDRQMGGGALLDLGVYPVSLADLLLGTPDRIVAMSTMTPSDVDGSIAAVLGYAGDASAVLTASLTAVGPNEAVIAGSEGTIRLRGPICAPVEFELTRRPTPPDRGATRAPGGNERFRDQVRERVRSSPPLARAARTTRSAVQSISRRGAERHRLGMRGNGYAHEAIEVMRCLREGRGESELMSLDHSIRVAETVDAIRLSAEGAR